MTTHGDAGANIATLQRVHRHDGRLATRTAVQPSARFGRVLFEGDRGHLVEVRANVQTIEDWISGGRFVVESGGSDYHHEDEALQERAPRGWLGADAQSIGSRRSGPWQGMDTLRDRDRLDRSGSEGRAPWAIWRHQHA